MSGWQPEYKPRRVAHLPPAIPPQWQHRVRRQGGYPAYGQTSQREVYPQPQQWEPPAWPEDPWRPSSREPSTRFGDSRRAPPQPTCRPPSRWAGGYAGWITLAVVTVIVIAGAAFYLLRG
jgi:hypothetical protein